MNCGGQSAKVDSSTINRRGGNLSGPKRILVKPGETTEERKAAVVAMYKALHGKEPSEQGLKDIDEVLAGVNPPEPKPVEE